VPARQPQCHCGVLWSESPDAHRATGGTGASSGGAGRTLLVLALIASASYGLYVAAEKRERSLQAAEEAQQERLRLEARAAGGGAPPPPTLAPAFTPSTYTPPVGGPFTLSSPRVEAAPATSKGRLSPASDASPSQTSMEEAWARASELLEAPLQKITAETAELQMQYAPFASTCLDSPAGNWLVAMRSGTFVRGGPTYSRFGVTMDCEFARKELVARGNTLKAEMEAAERLAHSNRVLPGHWRKLVETHQLEIWEAY
jgi:hypothetical protein